MDEKSLHMRLPASLDSRLQSFLTPWTDKLLKTFSIHNQSHAINNQMSVIDGCPLEKMLSFTTNTNIRSRPPGAVIPPPDRPTHPVDNSCYRSEKKDALL